MAERKSRKAGPQPPPPASPPRPLISGFDGVLEAIRGFPLRRVAVACAQDEAAVAAAVEARQRGIAEYVLVGDRAGILAAAAAAGAEVDSACVVDEPDPLKAAAQAVRLARDGTADIVMKGYIHTDDFLRAVLDKDAGLRTGSVMSHVFVLEATSLGRPLFVSDAAMNIAPNLATKADIILNALHVARMFGLEEPRVAVLAATEVVNPAMPATVEAATLAKMAEHRQFTVPCVIDGPFALDNALSEAAARHKKLSGPVAGRADVLIAPDIEAGNLLAKSFVYLAGGDVAGVLVGALRPVVLPSRADSARSKLFSIAVAVLMTNYEREGRLKIGKVHY
ncbi:MAG TPA: bifunctional enoyl-CoA hydratase/phosphate acetyltransferase [Planctomycetota bacterium]|nr:bifunctional enoyl-CoA hydratase/phosphate acetyltransferase [Planctomycetota bacterium]